MNKIVLGAMCVICDMNEYRKCARQLNSSLVNTLFDTLHALCNLLLVKPENLYQVCSGGHLVCFCSLSKLCLIIFQFF